MGGFEMKIPGMGGWVYKFSGSSCVSTQISSTPRFMTYEIRAYDMPLVTVFPEEISLTAIEFLRNFACVEWK